ncbi:integrase [Stutzerimonas stutzeri]|nr:integrase [Stutzerimonas stutzeri]RRV32268.1 integrase [Stutzerimonas stutzeri]RRV58753.1 integrase [Stutzerimonas stutzeri]RRV61412.1 integrase [Stutzerimonas stutzeri]RRV74419.1 integrase [Stutzerimonas stutzeri]
MYDLKYRDGGRQEGPVGPQKGSITSHYSAAELGKLIDEANKISATDSRGPALTILRRKAG